MQGVSPNILEKFRPNKASEVFKCDQCDHYFDTKMELKTHVDTKHEEPDFLQCKI